MRDKDSLSLLKSATTNSALHTIGHILQWVEMQRSKVAVNVKLTKFSTLDDWRFSDNGQSLVHKSGGFFSIDGLDVKTNKGLKTNWRQPIINQPEIGYLGFIVKEINGVIHFLVQAKIEPGNVNYVQLSPTLQATKSNYTLAHKGKAPAYLDYFINVSDSNTLLDQLQSEQGARFYKKRNRNIIIKIEDDVKLLDNFIWITLAQLKELMSYDNLVNMDTRTVVSSITYNLKDLKNTKSTPWSSQANDGKLSSKLLESMLDQSRSYNSFEDILRFITSKKCLYELNVQRIPLIELSEWVMDDLSIKHNESKYFRVIPVEVHISNREVAKWHQPMIEPAQVGLCAFICKEINGVLHFAVQAKLECGNFDLIEFAPTVQCLTGNYRDTIKNALPFLHYVLNVEKSKIIFDTMQSEEGGRFYREQNRNLLILAGDEVGLELPDDYIWMTGAQLSTFIEFNNYINIQARSIIAALPFKENQHAGG